MARGVARYLVGSLVVLGLAACGKMWVAERDAWRHEAEVACLKSGIVKEGPAIVRVEGETLTAGRAHIPVSALGPVVVLDAELARAVRGPESDPAAYHLIRGWVPAGVKAAVVDPNDPTPYWFVATRRPAELAAAIEAARTPSRG